MKLEINFRKKTEKNHTHMETKQHATKNQWAKEDIRKDIKVYSRLKKKIETELSKIYGTKQKQS